MASQLVGADVGRAAVDVLVNQTQTVDLPTVLARTVETCEAPPRLQDNHKTLHCLCSIYSSRDVTHLLARLRWVQGRILLGD